MLCSARAKYVLIVKKEIIKKHTQPALFPPDPQAAEWKSIDVNMFLCLRASCTCQVRQWMPVGLLPSCTTRFMQHTDMVPFSFHSCQSVAQRHASLFQKHKKKLVDCRNVLHLGRPNVRAALESDVRPSPLHGIDPLRVVEQTQLSKVKTVTQESQTLLTPWSLRDRNQVCFDFSSPPTGWVDASSSRQATCDKLQRGVRLNISPKHCHPLFYKHNSRFLSEKAGLCFLDTRWFQFWFPFRVDSDPFTLVSSARSRWTWSQIMAPPIRDKKRKCVPGSAALLLLLLSHLTCALEVPLDRKWLNEQQPSIRTINVPKWCCLKIIMYLTVRSSNVRCYEKLFIHFQHVSMFCFMSFFF